MVVRQYHRELRRRARGRDLRAVPGVPAGPLERRLDHHPDHRRRLDPRGGLRLRRCARQDVRQRAAALARHRLYRGVPRHLALGPVVLDVLRAPAFRRDAGADDGGDRHHRPQLWRLWRGARARCHQRGAARAVGGERGAQHVAHRGAPADHPAASLRGDDPALGQPADRTAQGHRLGVADHHFRSCLPGSADEPDHVPHGGDILAGAAILFRHRANDGARLQRAGEEARRRHCPGRAP